MTETQTMIERVALDLFWKSEHLDPSDEADNCDASDWYAAWPRHMTERRREFWSILAKHAIAAMREPTEAMINGGDERLVNADCRAEASIIWRDMIDAALKDAP